jgi:hypothetical protein
MGQAPVKTAMLMTAGLGTRLQPFTHRRTKALLPILGIPSAQYAIDSLRLAGVTKVVANVHHLPEDTARGLSHLDTAEVELVTKDESQVLLGTAGGIRNALGDLGSGPFFRANADVICDLDWSALYQTHLRLRNSDGVVLTLAVFPSGPINAHYPEILIDEKRGLITGIGKPKVSSPFWTGAAVIEPDALLGVPHSGPSEFVPEILLPAIRGQKAGLFLSEGIWSDIGAPELWLATHFELMRLFEMAESQNSRLKIWQERFSKINYSLGRNQWAHISNRPSLTRGAFKVEGPCYLGDGAHAPLANSQIGPHAVVYGQISEQVEKLENGIAFGGYWVKK